MRILLKFADSLNFKRGLNSLNFKRVAKATVFTRFPVVTR